MLTFRKGAAGSAFIGKVMAEYVLKDAEVSGMQAKMASYYGKTGEHDFATGMARADTDPRLAQLLGIDTRKPIEAAALAHLMTGLAADGKEIEGRSTQGVTEKKTRIAYIDLTFSAPKSFSVAMALARNHAERAILDRAHREAVEETLRFVADEVGLARRGKGGSKGAEVGNVTWFTFDHYSVRPTTKTAVVDNGVGDTVLQQVPVAGDPGRHTHAILPNVVLTQDGHVGGLYWKKTQGRVHEWGAVYQAFLGNNLRRHGIELELDARTLMGRLPAIPRYVDELFSKFHRGGEEAAKRHAGANGVDWEALTGKGRVEYLRGAMNRVRQTKGDGVADYDSWQQQADEAGYKHRSVLRPGQEQDVGPAAERLPAAFETSLPILAPQLERRSVFEGSVARIAAAKALIPHGIDTPADINVLTQAYRTEGVMQDGQMTHLEWGRAGEAKYASFTTGLHLAQENEAIGLLRAAAADKSSALTPGQVETAVRKVERDGDIRFEPSQRAMIDTLAAGGRVVAGIGAAGVGKTTLMRPLVHAWHDAGRETIGVTLAWRQTHALSDAGVGSKRRRAKERVPDARRLVRAGIETDRTYAMTAFLKSMEKGHIEADGNTVVVVDEISLVSTKQVLELARLQAKYGFQIVGIGDPKQCQAIESGSTIRLLQKALGTDQVPELLDVIRQESKRDRETAMLFRQGKAAEALARKDEDKTLFIVPGGYKQAVEAAVDLWQRRVEANKHDHRYSIGISVPTNLDARNVGEEIRRRRKAGGEIGKDDTVLKAVDQAGVEYDLPVSEGERVRLFNKVHAVYPSGKASRFGENGTVAEIVNIRPDGLNMRNRKGNVAFISWEQLRDQDNGRIRLTYGDAVTIDSRQSDTLTDHITCMPNGSQAVNGFKAYVADSRQRQWSAIITSQGEEQADIEAKRPLGDPRNQITARDKVKAAILENMAKNLSRQPEKQLATDFREKAHQVRRGTVRAMQAAWHRQEVREANGQTPTETPAQIVEKHEEAVVQAAVSALQEQQKAVSEAVKDVVQKGVPQARGARQQRAPRREMSESELIADFSAVLANAGFHLKGPPEMDGKMHYVPVEGDKRNEKRGSYAAHLDYPANGWFVNHRDSDKRQRWAPKVPIRQMTPEEREEARRANLESRQRREAELQAQDDKTAATAKRVWDNAKQANPRHPYLDRKKIEPHWLKQDRNGDLLVPMQDASGRIRNLQRIPADSTKPKLFMPGRTKGLYAVLGPLEPGKPVAIGEGYATLASLYESTALTSVIAFTGSNILPVAKTIRGLDAARPIIFAADNDHHLPRRNPPLPNVGIVKAHEAASEVGGFVVSPKWEPHERGTDWNDAIVKNGKSATREQLREALAGVGVRVAERSMGQGKGI